MPPFKPKNIKGKELSPFDSFLLTNANAPVVGVRLNSSVVLNDTRARESFVLEPVRSRRHLYMRVFSALFNARGGHIKSVRTMIEILK